MFVPIMVASMLIVLVLNFMHDEKAQPEKLRRLFGNVAFQWFVTYAVIYVVFYAYYTRHVTM